MAVEELCRVLHSISEACWYLRSRSSSIGSLSIRLAMTCGHWLPSRANNSMFFGNAVPNHKRRTLWKKRQAQTNNERLGDSSQRRALAPTFHGTKLKNFSQLEAQLGLGRNLLFSAAIDLRSGTTSTAYQSSDGSSLASAQERSQHSADCGAAAYILGRPLVRAQPTGARFSSDGDQITAPIYRDRAEV